MKLDSVARAVNEHLTTDELYAEIEKKSKGASGNRFFNQVFLGILIMFIGIVIGVAGQGMWGAKTAAVILALLGMLIMAYRFLPAAVRYDRDLLRSADKAAGKKEMRKAEPELNLPSADDFTHVPSVTEETTRNLDKNKTKVLR